MENWREHILRKLRYIDKQIVILIKRTVKDEFNFEPTVVYGGGLKEQNAGMLSKINTIDGGLVALTKFTGEIGFSVNELKRIIDKFLAMRVIKN